jgi:hypothetical protein
MSDKKKLPREARQGYQPTRAGLKDKNGNSLENVGWKDLKLPKWDTAIVPPSVPANDKPSQA